jgi:hypothetical protein
MTDSAHDRRNPELSDLYTLHRYYIWANAMGTEFKRMLAEASEAGSQIEPGTETGILAFMWMSYWYAALYVVIEGWRELGVHDEQADALLESPNVDLLRRYRNGVFHFQRQYFDARFMGLIDDGEDVVEWVESLNNAFSRVFLDAFGHPPEGAPAA